MRPLLALARAAGIDAEYTSWRGVQTTSSDEALLHALRALGPGLGFHIDRIEDASIALVARERARWSEAVPPVVVGWDGDVVVPMSVPAETDGDWEIEITTESGRVVRANGRLFALAADSHAWPGGVVHCVRTARIGLDGELGYHDVRWRVAGQQGTALAIAAPMRAWGGPGQGTRRWGVFAPVYGLASEDTGSAGDLSTLRRLFEAVARRGGSYVATLPVLAAFLDEPCAISPYSPASRLYWNELYLDLGALAADVGVTAPLAPTPAPGERIASPADAGRAALPEGVRRSIDYRAQYRWRRDALDAIAARMLSDPARRAALDAWALEANVYDYAVFRAIGEQQHAGWRAWPAQFRDHLREATSRHDAIGLGADRSRIGAHVVAQWAMQQQLSSLDGEVGLYLDLPVGVSCDAYEVWRHRELFLLEMSAGAPPDPLFLGGQDWGLPPLAPDALRRSRYRYFIDCVRHHMRVAKMLRIDHVMGLFRLYCVPSGMPATDGVYLRYHPDELLAILTLESTRARCAIVGEDLGTVPEGVRPAMGRHGMFRLHVGQWAFPIQPGDQVAASPPGSVACLNTHDTATFAGWWNGADIDDRHDLGLTTDDQEAAERVERASSKQAVLAAVGVPDPAMTDVERAMVGATANLAAGPAEVVLVTLDDLALELVPHNVPGTTYERPNWQHRVVGWADALDDKHARLPARAAIDAVVTARPKK